MRRYHASFSYQAGTLGQSPTASSPRSSGIRVSCTRGSSSLSPTWAVPPSGWLRSTISAARLNNGSRRAKTRSGGHACTCRRFDHRCRSATASRAGLSTTATTCGTLALPDAVEQWSLTSLREKLIKIGPKIVCHGRYNTCPDGRRLSFLVTDSPTSCAVTTGSDLRQPRHQRLHPVPSRRFRQDLCARIAGKNAIPRHRRQRRESSIIGDRLSKMAVIRRQIARRAVSSHTERAGTVPSGESRLSSDAEPRRVNRIMDHSG